jgi:hypothetical protein
MKRGRGDHRLVRLASKQRKGEGSGRGDQRRERRSIFFFFFVYASERRIKRGHERKNSFVGAEPDKELEGVEIGPNYFTKGLLKKGLMNFSGLRGCQSLSWPRP